MTYIYELDLTILKMYLHYQK